MASANHDVICLSIISCTVFASKTGLEDPGFKDKLLQRQIELCFDERLQKLKFLSLEGRVNSDFVLSSKRSTFDILSQKIFM